MAQGQGARARRVGRLLPRVWRRGFAERCRARVGTDDEGALMAVRGARSPVAAGMPPSSHIRRYAEPTRLPARRHLDASPRAEAPVRPTSFSFPRDDQDPGPSPRTYAQRDIATIQGDVCWHVHVQYMY